MPNSRNLDLTEWGAALLRVSLGLMFLAHSVMLKLLTYGLPGTAAFFEGVGLPRWLAYVTFACEAVGGTLLVLGVQTRWVALALSPFLAGALFAVHLPNGWVFTSTGGGWEYPLYLFVLCVAQALLGDGAIALSPSRPLGILFGRAAWQPAVPGTGFSSGQLRSPRIRHAVTESQAAPKGAARRGQPTVGLRPPSGRPRRISS